MVKTEILITKKESVVEQMIRGFGILTVLTYSQTPNALILIQNHESFT